LAGGIERELEATPGIEPGCADLQSDVGLCFNLAFHTHVAFVSRSAHKG